MSTNCIFADEGDPFDVVTNVVRTARKPWVCCECYAPIKPGDKYEHIRGLYDGIWSDFRTCTRCALVAADFFRGRPLEFMAEYFEEEHGFDYRDGIPADFTPCGADD